MNCDDAFNALTDPVRRHSRPLQAHLADCPRCRNMQTVLEPALELFDNSGAEFDGDTAAESAGVPQSPFLTAEAIQLAEQTAAHLAASHPHRREWRRRRALTAAGYAAVAVLGACLAFGLSAASRQRDNGGVDLADPVLAGHCLRNDLIADAQQSAQYSEPAARTAVLACVACHLAESTAHRQK